MASKLAATASIAAPRLMPAPHTAMTLRRSKRSVTSPVTSENKSSGPNPARPIMPSANVLLVLLKISQPVATTTISSAQPNKVSAVTKLAKAFL